MMGIVNQINSIVSNIMVNVAVYCSSNSVADQVININCDPGYGQNPDVIYELNPACTNCIDNIVAAQQQKYSFQSKLWANGSQKPGVNGSIDSDFQNVIASFVACGIKSCKACVIQNASQTTTISSVLNCQAFTDVQNTITQQVSDQINQQLTNNQDMLAPLAEMLGASSTNDVIQNITNRIMSQITETLISNIQSQIQSQQTMTFDSGSSTVNVVTQESAFTLVMAYLSKNQIFNNILDSSQWTNLENLINQQNTIGTLGDTVVQLVSYFTKLLSNIVGQVVFFVLILVGVVVFAIIIYITGNLISRAVQKRHEKQVDQEKAAQNLPAFESF